MSVAITSSHGTITVCEVCIVTVHDERSSSKVPAKLDVICGKFSVLKMI